MIPLPHHPDPRHPVTADAVGVERRRIRLQEWPQAEAQPEINGEADHVRHGGEDAPVAGFAQSTLDREPGLAAETAVALLRRDHDVVEGRRAGDRQVEGDGGEADLFTACLRDRERKSRLTSGAMNRAPTYGLGPG